MKCFVLCCLLIVVLLSSCDYTTHSNTTTSKRQQTSEYLLVRQQGVQRVGVGLGEREARKRLQQALNSQEAYPSTPIESIVNKEAAIAMAEPILFASYGQELILRERPYEVYLIDDYWFIRGTLPVPTEEMEDAWVGGTFEIGLRAKNGQVVHLTHYE